MSSYLRAALDAELRALSGTASGRAPAAFRAGAAIGGFVGAGELNYDDAESALVDAAASTGLAPSEARRNVRNGLRAGMKTPRSVPETARRTFTLASVPAPRSLLKEGLQRPPLPQVQALWGSASPIGTVPEAEEWFCHRYRDSAGRMLQLAESWDLVRALPQARLPRWASSRVGSWYQSGHRLVFRLWDASGRFTSLRARAIRPGVEPKSLAPAGYQVKGLVLADPLAVEVLSGNTPDWWVPEVVISEGEPDWLSWASRQSETHEEGPAYLGVEAGAWSQALADRIPEGSRVVIRTDHDGPGTRYAEQIVATLRGRCSVYRSVAETGVAA